MKVLDLDLHFEVFNRPRVGKRRQSSTPIVSLYPNPAGFIALNQAAYDALGAPEAVELLYERRLHIIGIQPSKAEHAIPVRNYRVSTHHISTGAFFTHFGLSFRDSLRIVALMVDGVLHVPLGETSGAGS